MPLSNFASGPDGFVVETLVEDGVTVVACSGELDLASAPELDAILRAAPDGPLVLDLCSCEFIDSSGLLVIVRHQVRPDGFAVACLVDGAPAQLFELAGMSQNGTSNPALLRVFPSRGAAVDSVGAARPRSG